MAKFSDSAPINVAIACQGGGAQTAFTAGALSRLLEDYLGPDARPRYRIVALSGTSGGALCAAMAWRDIHLGLPEQPTVERFWTSPYPRGNAALDFPQCLGADWQEFLAHGTLPGRNTAAHLRNLIGQSSADLTDRLSTEAPFSASIGLNPDYWHKSFAAYDASPLGRVSNAFAGEIGKALAGALAEPATRWLATVWGEVFDLSPLHAQSVVHPGLPPRARRDFDVQDAFREVLAPYFDQAFNDGMQARIDALSPGRALVPELLIGATAATGVHKTDIDAVAPSSGTGQSPDSKVRAARAKAIALEPHLHHRADRTSLRAFRGTRYLDRLVDCLLASAALPDLMRAPHIDGAPYWDGLYATNPPIYDLPDIHTDPADNPSEIWVIRINPTRATADLSTPERIADRQNELMGNLSLDQEIRHVIAVGGMSKPVGPDPTPPRYYHPITVGFIDMSHTVAAPMGLASKMSTAADQIDRLFDHGHAQMDGFLTRWTANTPPSAG